jgi:sulfate adenylyltransferase
LHGDSLSWLDLMLLGLTPARFELPSTTTETVSPTLAVPPDTADQVAPGSEVTLLDPEGVPLATLSVDGHTGSGAAPWIAGSVTSRAGSQHLDHHDLRVPPESVADAWGDGPVLALWADAPATFALRAAARDWAADNHGHLLELIPVPSGQETSRAANLGPRLARQFTTRRAGDQLVVVPSPRLGWTQPEVRLRADIVRQYGATHLVALGHQPAEAAGVKLVSLPVPADRQELTPDRLQQLLSADEPLPTWVAEPEVADEIRKLIRPPGSAGFTVLLSGLSGSGKSTVARALAIRLLETETRSVSLLDGDVVRHHLSKELGFARADRDTNVRRIGFVASEITKAGGIAICCPIAPYEATRQDVRSMIEDHGGFYLVHVATPLAECERRDRKGLYAKARRGEIPEFTGISDPYEIPPDAELTIDTTGRTIESCVDEVLAGLRAAGYLDS